MSVKKCNKCGKCCYSNIGAFVFPSDVKQICEFLHLEPVCFFKEYCDEHVLYVRNKNIKVFTLKIINKKCIFLCQNNLCKIFKYRPYQCVNAPYNFLSKYSFWHHMPCVSAKDFESVDSSISDKEIFSELLNNGYDKI